MFGGKTKEKEREVQALADRLNEKISELHLLIRSGKLTPQELTYVKSELKRLQRHLETKMITASAQHARVAPGT